jgi:flagellar hook-associated protein FlgK
LNLVHHDRQRVEQLQQRFDDVQKQIEDIREKFSSNIEIDHVIDDIDVLIKRLRDIDEQVRDNAMQPLLEYERLIPDCQVELKHDH